jgi:serpin B
MFNGNLPTQTTADPILNSCTYCITGNRHIQQYWRNCLTCFPNNAENGACLNCISICHDGHQIGPLRLSQFYCDCGEQRKCRFGVFAQKVAVNEPTFPFPFPNQVGPNHSVPHPFPFPNTAPSVNPLVAPPVAPFPFPIAANNTVKQPTSPFPNSVASTSSTSPFDSSRRTVEINFRSATSKLFRLFGLERGSSYRIFSPISIAMMLYILESATRSFTQHEIRSFLDGSCEKILPNLIEYFKTVLNTSFEITKPGGTDISRGIIQSMNMCFFRRDLTVNQEFMSSLSAMMEFNAITTNDMERLRSQINQEIARRTNQLIQDLLPSLPSSLAFIFVNIIYFKMPWLKPFQKSKTIHDDPIKHQQGFCFAPFHPFYNSLMKKDIRGLFYLSETFENIRYYADDKAQFIELDYIHQDYCFSILLPKKGTVPMANPFQQQQQLEPSKDYFEFFNNLDVPEAFLAYLNQAQIVKKVYVMIPKFNQRLKLELGKAFTNYSPIKQLFSPTQVDFSGFISKTSLPIEIEMIHEAVIIVDEEGTEAAAATAVVASFGCAARPDPIPEFRATSSFFFAIRHKPTNSLLFLGDFHGEN